MINMEEIVQNLSSMEADIRLKAVRDLKNAIIGNKTKKRAFVERGALPKLVDILNYDSDPQVLIQAAAAIGSFACGADDVVSAVVHSGAASSLVKHISNPNIKVVESTVRSLKLLYQSQRAPRDVLFQGETIMLLIQLLSNPTSTDSVIEVAASLLARCCESVEHQNAVDACGGVDKLIRILFSNYPKSQEAALDALSALSKDNKAIARKLVSNEKALNQIFKLVKDRRASIRLLAIKCAANLSRADVLGDRQQEIAVTVLPTLVKLFNEQDPIREEAPSILAYLIEGNEELQKAACDSDAVSKLASFLTTENVSDRMIESSLIALAALCSMLEECRKLVIEAKVLPHIVTSLESPNENIREAACMCTRSLSRSVKHLRTSLVDAGVSTPLFKLLNDPSTAVQSSVSATLCNIVLDFSPMKKLVIDNNSVPRLVSFTESMDHTLRLNSLWALKNLVFRADSTIKESVMKELTYPGLIRLLNDPEPEIQEQAMNLIRNLVHGETSDINNLLVGGGEELLTHIENKLATSIDNTTNSHNVNLLVQTLYVICNIAAGTEQQKEAVMRPQILRQIYECMNHPKKEVRAAAVWCLINFTWKEDDGVERRVRRLKEMGFEEKLLALKSDPDLDVRDRAKQALIQFGAAAATS